MRRENQPDGGNDKVTWKRSRDLLTRRQNNVSLSRGGDVSQGVIFLLSFETYRRLRRDVLMGRQG